MLPARACGFGVIAKFNRDFPEALDACVQVERVHALPRLISGSIDDGSIPESVVYNRKASAGKIAFLRRLWVHAWRAERIDLVICGRINLLSAG
jgi:hypothetical protein